MGKKKIIEAAKRKGLSVEYVDWGWSTGDYHSQKDWQVQFGEEIDELYGQDEVQSFAHTAEALEWIDSLEPVTHGEDE